MGLDLPASLIPEVIKKQQGIPLHDEYYFAFRVGEIPNLTLPTPPRKPGQNQVRFSIVGVIGGRYLASAPRTALFETWDASNQSWQVDLYKVQVEVHGIFDLRPPGIQAELELGSRECYQMANPPVTKFRLYPAWQYIAYAIWSAGFTGIIWKSHRSPGDSLCLYSLGPNGSIGKPEPVLQAIDVPNWLAQNP